MQEFFTGVGNILIYYVVCASAELLLRLLTKIPDEPFRKLLHMILITSSLVFAVSFNTWWYASVFSLIFAALVYPILMGLEHIKSYSKTLTERKSGELKSSLLVVFTMFAFVFSVCWGLVGDRLLAVASIYAWGIGDAAAALVGKKFGKHKIPNSKKSFEGSLSMFVSSFVSVLVVLLIRGGMEWYAYLTVSLAVAAMATLTELYTTGGFDTVTCPVAAMAVMLPLIHLFGGGI